MITAAELIDGYTQMVTDRIQDGWSPYLLTFMFHPLNGSPDTIGRQMEREVERVYGTMLPRIVRKPRSLAHLHKLPVWLGCPDFPVPKHDRKVLRDVAINDGLHVHTISLLHPRSRMKEDFRNHIEEEHGRYVRHDDPLFRIHVEPIDRRPGYVVGYAFKAMAHGRVRPDQTIILPRSIFEPTRAQPE